MGLHALAASGAYLDPNYVFGVASVVGACPQGEEGIVKEPRWTDGYRTIVGPYPHEGGWRFEILWAGGVLVNHYDFDSWAEAHRDYTDLIAAWTDPDGVAIGGHREAV